MKSGRGEEFKNSNLKNLKFKNEKGEGKEIQI